MKRLLPIFIAFLFIQHAAFGGVSGAAAKKQLPDMDTLRSSLSANRSLIKRFESEYDTLLRRKNPSKEDSKKIAALKNKILLLKYDNGRFLNLLSESSGSASETSIAPRLLTGGDWVVMQPKDKELYLFSTMGALVEKEVLTMRPSRFYIQKIDQCLAHRGEFEKKKLDDILLLNIYKYEPDTRDAIASFKKIEPNDPLLSDL